MRGRSSQARRKALLKPAVGEAGDAGFVPSFGVVSKRRKGVDSQGRRRVAAQNLGRAPLSSPPRPCTKSGVKSASSTPGTRLSRIERT